MKPFFNYSRASALFPVIILLLNIVLRFTDILTRDISLDEPFSIYHAQLQPGFIIDTLKNYNNPPLFELLLHYWIKLFGIDPLSVRILPALFSIAASVSLYFLGKKYFTQVTGLIAALLLSFSSLSQAYAHDCRVYSLFLLLSILSMNVFLSLMRKPALKKTLLFIFLTTLNIYSHYFAIILFTIQGLCVIFFYREKIKHFALASLFVILLYIPHVIVLFERFFHSAENGTWVESPQGLESVYNMLWSFSNQPVATVIAIIFFLALLFRTRKCSKEIKVILLWFLIPVTGIFLLSFKIPMYLDRYLIFCSPAWYLLLAAVPERLSTNLRIQWLAAITIVASFVLSYQSNPWTERHIAAAVSHVKKNKTENCVVIVSPKELIETFSYHYKRDFFRSIRNGEEYNVLDSLMKTSGVLFLNNINELSENDLMPGTIIYFDYNTRLEREKFISKLSGAKNVTSDTTFKNGYRVIVFETTNSP